MSLFDAIFGSGGKQKTKVPKYLTDAHKRSIDRAETGASVGYMPYMGPAVAALTPGQEAAMGANRDLFAAMGGPVADSSGYLPEAQDFGGIKGHSAYPIFEFAKAEWEAKNPGQAAAYNSLFVDPQGGGGKTSGGSTPNGSLSGLDNDQVVRTVADTLGMTEEQAARAMASNPLGVANGLRSRGIDPASVISSGASGGAAGGSGSDVGFSGFSGSTSSPTGTPGSVPGYSDVFSDSLSLGLDDPVAALGQIGAIAMGGPVGMIGGALGLANNVSFGRSPGGFDGFGDMGMGGGVADAFGGASNPGGFGGLGFGGGINEGGSIAGMGNMGGVGGEGWGGVSGLGGLSGLGLGFGGGDDAGGGFGSGNSGAAR